MFSGEPSGAEAKKKKNSKNTCCHCDYLNSLCHLNGTGERDVKEKLSGHQFNSSVWSLYKLRKYSRKLI